MSPDRLRIWHGDEPPSNLHRSLWDEGRIPPNLHLGIWEDGRNIPPWLVPTYVEDSSVDSTPIRVLRQGEGGTTPKRRDTIYPADLGEPLAAMPGAGSRIVSEPEKPAEGPAHS